MRKQPARQKNAQLQHCQGFPLIVEVSNSLDADLTKYANHANNRPQLSAPPPHTHTLIPTFKNKKTQVRVEWSEFPGAPSQRRGLRTEGDPSFCPPSPPPCMFSCAPYFPSLFSDCHCWLRPARGVTALGHTTVLWWNGAKIYIAYWFRSLFSWEWTLFIQ